MLPEDGAVIALEAAIALTKALDMLGRDINVVDLRNPSKPVLRLGIDARNSIREARGMPILGPDGKVLDENEKKGG